MRTIIRYAWAYPLGRFAIIGLILLAIIVGIYEFIKESQEGEALREKDKQYGDSIWKDQ